MKYDMRTYVVNREDTCKWWSFLINVSHVQIRHTSCLYGGLKPIQTLGSVMTCADRFVRVLFDIITVCRDMPLPTNLVESSDGTPSRIFRSQSDIFGPDTDTINLRWNEEPHAYYGLVSPSAVLSHVSMSREYDGDGMSHSNRWLEPVTLSG